MKAGEERDLPPGRGVALSGADFGASPSAHRKCAGPSRSKIPRSRRVPAGSTTPCAPPLPRGEICRRPSPRSVINGGDQIRSAASANLLPRARREAPDRRQLDYANALFSDANSTTSRSRNTKNSSGQYPGASRSRQRLLLPRGMLSCLESQRRRRAPLSKVCWMIMARVSLPGQLLTGSLKFFLTKRIMRERRLCFIARQRSRRKRGLPSRRVISKRAAWRISIARTMRRTFTCKWSRRRIRILIAKMRVSPPARSLVARGRKSGALKQYEALANETGSPRLKAEATVRAGMVAIDLQQGEKGKPDKAMQEKALTLLQKGRSLPEAGRWSGIAEAGLLRLLYSTGQYAQVLSEYTKGPGPDSPKKFGQR